MKKIYTYIFHNFYYNFDTDEDEISIIYKIFNKKSIYN